MRKLTRIPVSILAAVGLLACGGDPFTASVDTVAGHYHASVLTITQGSTTSDLLQAGGSVDITLNADGTTSGRLLIPGGGETGQDLDVDLVGTWALTDGQVSFTQEGDTFIRDVPFTAARNSLSAEHSFNPGTVLEFTVRAVLVK